MSPAVMAAKNGSKIFQIWRLLLLLRHFFLLFLLLSAILFIMASSSILPNPLFYLSLSLSLSLWLVLFLSRSRVIHVVAVVAASSKYSDKQASLWTKSLFSILAILATETCTSSNVRHFFVIFHHFFCFICFFFFFSSSFISTETYLVPVCFCFFYQQVAVGKRKRLVFGEMSKRELIKRICLSLSLAPYSLRATAKPQKGCCCCCCFRRIDHI